MPPGPAAVFGPGALLGAAEATLADLGDVLPGVTRPARASPGRAGARRRGTTFSAGAVTTTSGKGLVFGVSWVKATESDTTTKSDANATARVYIWLTVQNARMTTAARTQMAARLHATTGGPRGLAIMYRKSCATLRSCPSHDTVTAAIWRRPKKTGAAPASA